MAVSKRSSLEYILLFIAVALLVIPNIVTASEACYDDKYFPHAIKLTETSDGIEVVLGGIYAKNCEGPVANIIVPIIVWQKNNIWKNPGERKSGRCDSLQKRKCPIKMTDWPKALPTEFCKGTRNYKSCLEYAHNGEEASSCVITKDSVWFGINFYEGEGYFGYGGLGRYDRKTDVVDVRRLPALKEYAIHQVAWDGRNIWAATTNNYECTGHEPALGLIKYDWEKDTLTTYKDTETGPCGFIINELLWSQGSLWVATDVGVSRWDAGQDKWIHYLPDIKPPYAVVVSEGSCDVFYKSILDSLTKEKIYLGGPESPYSFFYNYLRKFRPDFMKRYETKQ